MSDTWKKGPKSGWQGGSTGRWRRVRRAKIQNDPLCEDCKRRQKVTEAKQVHHIVPLSEGGSRFDTDNLMSLCAPCHQRRHGSTKGSDERGFPLDPTHPWNNE
jgi:5-methylcytosine-specific restriction endonuclease McrA